MSNTKKITPVKDTGPLDLDTLVSEANKDPFRFTLAGKEREFPHVETLNRRQLFALEEDFPSVLGEITDADTVEAVEALPVFALEQLLVSWVEHAGLKPGELLASLRS